MLIYSSPDSKSHARFCNHFASVTVVRNFYISIFLSDSQLKLNMRKYINIPVGNQSQKQKAIWCKKTVFYVCGAFIYQPSLMIVFVLYVT